MKLVSLFFALSVLSIACSNNDDNATVTSQDSYFMQQAAYSNFAEISAGSIASLKGNNDSVRLFGTMMVADHGTAESALDSLGNALHVSLPSTPDTAHIAVAAMLQTLSGNVFDTTYIGAQVKDHINTIALFQQELASGNNTQVKNYATKYLPKIQMHLEEAQRIQLLVK